MGALAVLALALGALGLLTETLMGSPQAAGRLAGRVLASPETLEAVSGQLGWYLDGLASYGVDQAVIDQVVVDVSADTGVRASVEASAALAWSDITDGDGSAFVTVPGAEVTAAVRRAVSRSGLDPSSVPEVGSYTVAVPVPEVASRALGCAGMWPWVQLAGGTLALGSVLVATDRRRAAARLVGQVVLISVVWLVGLWAAVRYAGSLPGGVVAQTLALVVGPSVTGPLWAISITGAGAYALLRWAPGFAVRGARGAVGRPVRALVLVPHGRRR